VSETILAIIAAFSIIAAALMAALAYRLNEKWIERNMEWHELCREQNDLMKRMNREWHEAYMKMVDMKAEAAENERD
jgi:peptidoglycan/LPS O-acetylase OafA/YrhL